MSYGRGLTRRDVLSGAAAAAAAAGAGLLLGPAARASAASSPGGRIFTYGVGTLDVGTAPVIAPGRPFVLAGVRWSSPARARIELRARRAGRWGPWGVASSQGHDGDGVTATDHVGEGMWTGPATEVQLRSSAKVRGVAVQFVCAEPTAPGSDVSAAVSSALPLATPSLPAGPGQPPIIARQAWAGNDHRPTSGPFYGTIELGIVHHTENPNGYSPAEVPALLRAIYEFHVHGRGWFDIGYNFVIDHFGRIWEAREGGIDLPVIGAQAGDWNQLSFGVSLLGTFTDVVPPPAALDALQRLLAWKMALNGLPVLGDIASVVAAAGVAYTQFRAGEHIRLPRIAGHRDVDSTECPGGALYDRLPSLRPRVAQLAGAPGVLALDAELGAFATGPVLTLSGRLTRRGGGPLAGAPIEIRAVGATAPLATTTTAGDGRWTAALTPPRGGLVLAVHRARPAVVSSLVALPGAAG